MLRIRGTWIKTGRWWKYPLLVIGLVGLCGLAFYAIVYLVFVRGRVWRENIGGQWTVKYQDSILSHSGLHATLLRREGFRRTLTVDELVQSVRFYGEDCVAYSTTRGRSGFQYLAACGSRLPAQLVPPTFDEWELRDEGLLRTKVLGEEKKSTFRIIPVGEIKERARRQPPLRDKWFEHSPPGS